MNNCIGCKYIDYTDDRPCKYCDSKYSNWTPNKEIAKLIKAAERKGFQAARESGNFTKSFDAKDLANMPFKYKSYEDWKETSK